MFCQLTPLPRKKISAYLHINFQLPCPRKQTAFHAEEDFTGYGCAGKLTMVLLFSWYSQPSSSQYSTFLPLKSWTLKLFFPDLKMVNWDQARNIKVGSPRLGKGALLICIQRRQKAELVIPSKPEKSASMLPVTTRTNKQRRIESLWALFRWLVIWEDGGLWTLTDCLTFSFKPDFL